MPLRVVVPEEWRSDVTIPLYTSKGERTGCKNYKVIRLLRVIRKMCAGVLADRVRRLTEGLSDDEQGGV